MGRKEDEQGAMEASGEEAAATVRKSRSSSCVRLKGANRTPSRKRSASGSRRRRNSMLKRVRVSDSKEVFLKDAWTFWYDEQPHKGMTHSEYENSVVRIGTFDTIQAFWRYYNNIVDPAVFPAYSNLRMFKANIKPLWEDPANSNGGKWTISVPKGQTGKCWIRVILFVIASQLTHIDDVCGIVLSVRPQKDTIQIWNRSASNEAIVTSITHQLSDLLQSCDLGPTAPYVTHGAKKAKNRRRIQSATTPGTSHEGHGDGGARRSDTTERPGSARHQRALSDDLDLSGEEECFPLEFDADGLIKPKRSASTNDLSMAMTGSKIRHKKSESVSGPSFGTSQMAVRQHRKSRSDSQQRRCAIPYRAMGSGAKAKAIIVPRKSVSMDAIPPIQPVELSSVVECDNEPQAAPKPAPVASQPQAEEARANALQTRSQKVNSDLENLYNQIYKPKPEFTPLAVPKSTAIARASSPRLQPRAAPADPAKVSVESAKAAFDDAVADPGAAMGGSPWFILNLLVVVLMIAVAYLAYTFLQVSNESIIM
mmetsp:Transcript_20166/g.77198  ORF Transcript_20166/g.77198 Transcript_20166/m.77198 type:complete len:538 (-) Transcript_20166:35-1648(-)